MDTAQDIMYEEMRSLNAEVSRKLAFKTRLKKAAEEGILIFVKYALVALLLFGALQYFNVLVSGAQNGTQSALYLSELIQKGYLPKAGPNGIEPKSAEVK